MTAPKTMNRSRNQLASSYAPGSFFAFEGGVGACIAQVSRVQQVDLSQSTLDQLYERLEEIGRSWYDMASNCRAAGEPTVLPRQCVDISLLDSTHSNFQLIGQDKVHFCRPSQMEYSPAPLAFRCQSCGLFRDFDSLDQLDAQLGTMATTPCRHLSKPGPCSWKQLDVVFVHWSGNWEQPFPGQWQWSAEEKKSVKRRDRCGCGSADFTLNNRPAAIGSWFFECAMCKRPLSQRWLQNDKATLDMIRDGMTAQRLTEARMQVTPYRASNAYYVQSDLFIDFKDGAAERLSLLRPERSAELQDFIARQYGFPAVEPTDAEVEEACEGEASLQTQLVNFRAQRDILKSAEPMLATAQSSLRTVLESSIAAARLGRQAVINELRAKQVLTPKVDLPAELAIKLRGRRSHFASKYDPFRLSIEHQTLDDSRLAVKRQVLGKRPFVPFTQLDADLSPATAFEKDKQEAEAARMLKLLGIEKMGLIRDFELCKFSFGYSRMESGPVLRAKRGMDMPVRLKLFDSIRFDSGWKHPIYVVQQANEAVYVKLDEAHVLAWLRELNCPDMVEPVPGQKLGASLLQMTHPMSAFLDGLPTNERPPAYLYTYTLLHSFSHMLMKHMSEYSGLDIGSLGEYIFPTDLAFVVYRNGTTMDLGNFSAMWRNAGVAMLSAMLRPKSTLCGTGSLCSSRGGACPDCLMVPETSCVASNKLLSRSVLRGNGGRPRLDRRAGFRTPGFLDLVQRSST